MHGYRDYVAACCCGTVLIALLLARTAAAHAHILAVTDASGFMRMGNASSNPVSLGAHTLLTQPNGLGVSPAITAAITTQSAGSALIILEGGYANNATTPKDNYANAWRRVGNTVVFNGYGSSFDVRAYVAMQARGGAGHRVTVPKNMQPEGEVSIPFIEIKNAGMLKDLAQNYPEPGLVVTSGKVTTTAAATLVAVWWGDAGVKRMTATPNNGFTVIDSFLKLPDESGVQCAVASRQVAAAGTYDVSWTSAPVQGAILWLFAFQSG